MRTAISRLIALPIRRFLYGIGSGLWCVPSVLAAVDVCQEPADSSYVSMARYADQNSSIENAPGKVSQDNNVVDLLLKLNDEWSIGVGHQYTILNVEPLELQTNGDLHTFFIPMHRQKRSDHLRFRFSLAPSISASSNVMKDPSEYNADAMQLLAALVWSRKFSSQTSIRYGICGDNRFGGYEIYPMVSVDWQPHPDWRTELGFPTSQLHYRISASLSSSLRLTPDGNEWYVTNKSMQQRSRLKYESYLLDWALGWRANKRLTLTANIGWKFNDRYELSLADESRAKFSVEPLVRFGAGLVWRF